MQKTCANAWCKQSFEITDEDLAFYERMSPGGKVCMIPPPTLCPRCRNQKRHARRNERHLHHRTCDLTGAPIISIYGADEECTVYAHEEWWKDTWDPLDEGRPFDPNRPFFD